LLVLDNLEHLLPAGPDLARLLSACEQLKILVTSRAWLRIRAERPYQLEPLELPDLEALPAAGELARIASVELFVDRAMAADREFALTPENARNIAEITVRLDGLPLAIELAVARLTVMSTSDLLRHLEHRIPFLTGGARDLPERLQALRAAIDWSYELLDSDEQRLFRRLAVFSGGFTLEAVERVNGGLPALDELTSLVQKSLVHAASVTAESRRFSLLETIREYGLERLAAADELAEARTNHLAWCLEFLERRSYDQLGSELIHWIRLLDIEHDNIRTSLTWAIESGQIDAAERLCGACYQYWIHRGLGDEGHRWLERVQQMEGETSPGTRAGMMLAAGSIAYARGEYEREPVLEKALQLYRETGNKAGMAITLRAMGLFAQDQSHFARAESLKRESLALFRKLGNDVMATRVLGGLGLNAYDRGDFEQAEVLLEEALVLSREQEIWITMASVLNNLALVAIEFGDLDRATALQQEALEEWRTLRYSVAVAHSLENLARIALRRDEWERGVVLFGASTTARIMIGTPGRLVDREENDKLVREVRSKVGEPAFNAYWEQGRSMTTDEAIDFALEDVSRP
jgi:predicted ATPase